EDDPYLVVAADKGTATFSDLANSIAQEYGFWLDDAFASRGSAGDDHKKMGITARGAWESVKQLFRELGVDTQSTDFTVVGIGDMSGDVFGNGMLLSRHIKLVGAFNHLHVFLDPDPDPDAALPDPARPSPARPPAAPSRWRGRSTPCTCSSTPTPTPRPPSPSASGCSPSPAPPGPTTTRPGSPRAAGCGRGRPSRSRCRSRPAGPWTSRRRPWTPTSLTTPRST